MKIERSRVGVSDANAPSAAPSDAPSATPTEAPSDAPPHSRLLPTTTFASALELLNFTAINATQTPFQAHAFEL